MGANAVSVKRTVASRYRRRMNLKTKSVYEVRNLCERVLTNFDSREIGALLDSRFGSRTSQSPSMAGQSVAAYSAVNRYL